MTMEDHGEYYFEIYIDFLWIIGQFSLSHNNLHSFANYKYFFILSSPFYGTKHLLKNSLNRLKLKLTFWVSVVFVHVRLKNDLHGNYFHIIKILFINLVFDFSYVDDLEICNISTISLFSKYTIVYMNNAAT